MRSFTKWRATTKGTLLVNFRSRLVVLPLVVVAMLSTQGAQAEDANAEIRRALTTWMADFNAGRADKVCDLFAPDLRADFRGQPERNYQELCALLKRSLAERRFSYALDIKEVLVFGDLAIVRLVWTLTVKGENGSETTSAEPGLDVFQRQADGKWRIVRFMAYEK